MLRGEARGVRRIGDVVRAHFKRHDAHAHKDQQYGLNGGKPNKPFHKSLSLFRPKRPVRPEFRPIVAGFAPARRDADHRGGMIAGLLGAKRRRFARHLRRVLLLSPASASRRDKCEQA